VSVTTCSSGRPASALRSTAAILPPKVGGMRTAARSIPGRATSVPKTALPSTLAGASTRGRERPRRRQSLRGLSGGSAGGVRFAAVAASSPKERLLPVGRWTTRPPSTASRFGQHAQRSPAAPSSISRAAAPHLAQVEKKDEVLSLLPVKLPMEAGVLVVGGGPAPLDLDPRPVGAQLLGEDGGERRADPLAHLGLRDHQGHPVVGADPHPGVERRPAGGGRRI